VKDTMLLVKQLDFSLV